MNQVMDLLFEKINREVDISGIDISRILTATVYEIEYLQERINEAKCTVINKQFNTGIKKCTKIRKLQSMLLYYLIGRDQMKDVEELNTENYETEQAFLEICNSSKNIDMKTIKEILFHYCYAFCSGNVTDFIVMIQFALDILTYEKKIINFKKYVIFKN